jgi:hypothetical protein
MTSVELLGLGGTRTAGGLRHLRGLTRLRVLSLYGTHVGDRDLEHILHLPIEYLNIAATDVTDAGVLRLKGHKTLRELTVDGSISADVGRELARANPRLRIDYHDETQHGYQFPKPRSDPGLLPLPPPALGPALGPLEEGPEW